MSVIPIQEVTMKAQVPERSLAQRRSALRKANTIRTHRAHQKRELRAGRLGFAELLDDPLCETMKAWDALVALPKIGRTKANRALVQLAISPSKTIGGLTGRQRSALLEHLS